MQGTVEIAASTAVSAGCCRGQLPGCHRGHLLAGYLQGVQYSSLAGRGTLQHITATARSSQQAPLRLAPKMRRSQQPVQSAVRWRGYTTKPSPPKPTQAHPAGIQTQHIAVGGLKSSLSKSSPSQTGSRTVPQQSMMQRVTGALNAPRRGLQAARLASTRLGSAVYSHSPAQVPWSC